MGEEELRMRGRTLGLEFGLEAILLMISKVVCPVQTQTNTVQTFTKTSYVTWTREFRCPALVRLVQAQWLKDTCFENDSE